MERTAYAQGGACRAPQGAAAMFVRAVRSLALVLFVGFGAGCADGSETPDLSNVIAGAGGMYGNPAGGTGGIGGTGAIGGASGAGGSAGMNSAAGVGGASGVNGMAGASGMSGMGGAGGAGGTGGAG